VVYFCGVLYSVLYISIHGLDMFPGRELSTKKVGSGHGAGFNINIPWTKVLYTTLIY